MYKSRRNWINLIGSNKRQVAILLDPEKVKLDESLEILLRNIETAGVNYIFVGGSTVSAQQQAACLEKVRSHSKLPIVIFPGSPEQINEDADALLFLNLISGRNPDYLIGHHVNAAPKLKDSSLEIIPTAYILVDGGKETTVQKISRTQGLNLSDTEQAINTVLAGVMMGNLLVYLDAGSGAISTVPVSWIYSLSNLVEVPIVVGGGIRSIEQIEAYFNAGAHLVVIGNHVESNPEFLLELATFLVS